MLDIIYIYDELLAANAAFLISENVLEACGRYYGCAAPYRDLKSKIREDRNGQTVGLTFLDLYKGSPLHILLVFFLQ